MDPISQQAFVAAGAGGSDPLYVDDVFSIDLYRNDSTTEEFNNGLDMAGEGGLIVTTFRDLGTNRAWVDSERGASKVVYSDSSNPETTQAWIQSFDDDGFTHGSYIGTGDNSGVVSWSFRKAPGFFDVVTYTGNGTSGRTISHSLGSVPGMIMLKQTSATARWFVYHRSTGNGNQLTLDDSNGAYSTSAWNNTTPTSTEFTLNDGSLVNGNGETYVAYLFAHDDQSFGTNSDEAIIKCGSYTGTGTSGNVVNVGFEPQFLLIKQTNTSRNWYLADNMRGIASGQYTAYLQPNINHAETDGAGNTIDLHATGFELKNHSALVNQSSGTYAYVAIRRPHKPPEAGTDVFKSVLQTGHPQTISVGFPTDLAFTRDNTNASNNYWVPRLTNQYLISEVTNTEGNGSSFQFDLQNSFSSGTWWGSGGPGTTPVINYYFKRAPGVFDVVIYTGNGANTHNVSHNLEAVPQLMIVKKRNESSYSDWTVYYKSATAGGANKYLYLNSNSGETTHSTIPWNNTEPTATQFTLYNSWIVNRSGYNYVAYLFASLDGISKVGTYSGTGYDVNVDCGFTAGARFVMIKRTDSTGDWYVWDTTRGIVSGNDSYFRLNTGAAPVTNTDYIDPLNAGFTVTSSAPAALNTSGGTYLFLAIA